MRLKSIHVFQNKKEDMRNYESIVNKKISDSIFWENRVKKEMWKFCVSRI
jgi:hypothetical protein